MEKIIYIEGYNTAAVNTILKDGWKVKFIVPFFENVSSGSLSNHGRYGAYVVLESTT